MQVAGLAGWAFPVVTQWGPRWELKARPPWEVAVTQLATLPVIVDGVSVIAGTGGGLYWLVPGLVLLAGVENAWVLLVEIMG